MCAVCSKAVFHLPYQLGTPSAKCQTFRGIQTAKSAAVWGSSELRGHFSPNEIKEPWASGCFRKALTRFLSVSWGAVLISGVLTLLQRRCLWGDAEENRMSLCSFLEEVWLSCKPEACAGLLPFGRLAWLADTSPASSSMVRVSSVGHTLWLAMLLFAISLPSWIRAATDC